MQWDSLPPPDRAWRLQRRVLPQHTDHAGVMWHGAYIAWLEEARVEALASVGLDYSTLSEQGLEMPVVELALTYRAPLLHGDRAEVRSLVMPRRGLRLPWRSWLQSGLARCPRSVAPGPLAQVVGRGLLWVLGSWHYWCA